ncbi:MAG: lycopene cyclase family protein [Gordonia sp. (in: high G+C Gram-positive bacteria)]|uniref:lycopene cyclase family protein n=1 Tax=Gordonia sp. (in: high G+C Gram-positive bacteria) TaxID=84139 RepID=UPI0039E386BA
MTDLLVVGAGPAGRGLAHRALAAGHHVTLIDPDPDTPWTATLGLFTDDLPGWLDADAVVAARSPVVTIYTPGRRDIDRGYAVLDAAALHRTLDVTGAKLERQRVTELTARTATLDDGRTLRGDVVIDARGGRAVGDVVRQTAWGVVSTRAPSSPGSTNGMANADMVLMDWRSTPEKSPSFVYRVDVGHGAELIEETCLAGRPAPDPQELGARLGRPAADGRPELVDFPLTAGRHPWKQADDAPLRFGAAGGLMNPATGYSIAASLNAADVLVAAISEGTCPRRALWPRGARSVYRIRLIGLGVLLGLDGSQLTAFFDAFFRLPAPAQRAYLSSRDDVAGTLSTMWSVFRRLPLRLQGRVIGLTVRSAVRPPA